MSISNIVSRLALKTSLFLCLSSLFSSCKKFIDIDPPQTELGRVTVFQNDVSAEAAMLGIYSSMRESGNPYSGDQSSINFLAALSADEIINISGTYDPFRTNELQAANLYIGFLWSKSYNIIYRTNSIIEGINNSENMSAAAKTRLEGEAKFVRAFCYFYLVNLFGEIPLVITSDYQTNTNIGRSDKAEIYRQILSDLQQAVADLPEDYIIYTNERVRPTSFGASALLARVYLYNSDWENAETLSSSVIDKEELFTLASLSDVFLKNSSEAIWQLGGPLNLRTNIIAFDYPTYNSSIFTPQLDDSFENNDPRKTVWVGSVTENSSTYSYATKYKQFTDGPATEYSMVLRLAEQYFIRAEARIKNGNIDGGIDDLNVVRNRARNGNAGVLPDIPHGLSEDNALNKVDEERRLELFTEWGDRWFNLKRRGKADDVLQPVKPLWQPEDKLYPIPQSQILNDPAMRDAQNPGYN